MSDFNSCPVCREQLDQCLQCGSYVVNGERIYYEKLADFGATNDSERRFIKRIQKHSTTAFFHNGTLYIPSRQGRSVHLAIGLQWEAWQEQQSEIDQLKGRISYLESAKNGYRDKAQELQRENERLKAKNTALVHALVNTNAEKTKWAHEYWAEVERTAEYGAMLISNPDSLEFSCFKKEKEIDQLKAEKAGLEKRINGGIDLIESLYKSEFNQRSNSDIHISQVREVEKTLRGEHE